MPQHIVPCPDHTYRSVCLRHCIPPPGPEVDINTWTIIGPQNQLTPALGPVAPCGACIQIDGRAPTQQDVGTTWIVSQIGHDWNGDPVSHPVFGTGPIPLYSGLNTWQTGTVSTHYYTRAIIESVQPATGTWSGHTVPAGNWITEPGVTSCAPPIVFWNDSWSCKTDKFGSVACVDPNNGTGIYNSLQDCQNNCVSTLISNDSFKDNLRDIIKPWIDTEGGPCLHDIKTCPCGWDYVQNYQPPVQTPLHQWVHTMFAGADVCLSSDYSLMESTLNVQAVQGDIFLGIQEANSIPCANLQGAYNPTVGMTIEGTVPNPVATNYLAGSITNVINGTSYTHTWDKHVIVEVNPAFNSSILNLYLQVIPSTPC